MNLIFLDVDGVLNSTNKLIEIYKKDHKSHSGFSYPFDEKCLENLQILVRETNSKLVVTSTWRKNKQGIDMLLNKLKEYGLDKDVIGYTPILLNEKRSTEIKKFLFTLNDRHRFIILDDDADMGELTPFLVKTNRNTGLTYENVEEGIKKINLLKTKIQEDNER